MKAFTLINISIVFTFVWACSGSSPGAVEQEQRIPSKTVTSNDKKKPAKKLTDENAVGFLRSYAQEHPEEEAVIHTSYGDIRIRLYENTPLHRANFIYLTKKGYFNDTWFYRVSKGHVIQAGNTDNRSTTTRREALGDYHIPAEIIPANYHKKGVVAAARSYKGNPDKRSDPFEFYIVLGKNYSKAELRLLAEKEEMGFTDRQISFYANHTGAPHLDGEHTVFGEVIDGMEVVEAINRVKVDEGEWPYTNIPIEVKIMPLQ